MTDRQAETERQREERQTEKWLSCFLQEVDESNGPMQRAQEHMKSSTWSEDLTWGEHKGTTWGERKKLHWDRCWENVLLYFPLFRKAGASMKWNSIVVERSEDQTLGRTVNGVYYSDSLKTDRYNCKQKHKYTHKHSYQTNTHTYRLTYVRTYILTDILKSQYPLP